MCLLNLITSVFKRWGIHLTIYLGFGQSARSIQITFCHDLNCNQDLDQIFKGEVFTGSFAYGVTDKEIGNVNNANTILTKLHTKLFKVGA